MSMADQFSVSDAIDSIGANRFIWKLFFLVGLTVAFDGFDYMLVSYTMPQISEEWNLNPVLTGSLASWSIIGVVVGSAIAGLLSDRFGRKKIIIISIIIFSIGTLPIYFIESFPLYAIFRIISGFGIGACTPITIVMISEFSPTKNRAIFVGLSTIWMTIGYVLAGVVSSVVIPALGWRTCYLIGAVPCIWAVILYFFLPETPHWQATHGQKEEAVKTIIAIRSAGKQRGRNAGWKAENLVYPAPPKSVGVHAVFKKSNLSLTLKLCVMYFMSFSIIYGINSWMPTLMLERGYDLNTAYAYTIGQNICGMIAASLTGFSAEAFGRRRTVMVGFASSIITIIAMSFANVPWFILVACLAVGFTRSFTGTSVQPFIAECYRTEYRNTALSWISGFGRTAGIIMPLVGGLMLSAGFGYVGATIIYVIPAFIGLVAVYLIKVETRGKSLETLAQEFDTEKEPVANITI